jgi:rare lipoprotein A
MPSPENATMIRTSFATLAAACLVAASSVGAADRKPDPLRAHVGATQHGRVSWYGPGFAGRPTASGERFDPRALTMAHRTLPLGTRVRVENPENSRSVVVRVNDRGPYTGGRVADLSRAAAERIGMTEEGVIDARLRVVSTPPRDDDS